MQEALLIGKKRDQSRLTASGRCLLAGASGFATTSFRLIMAHRAVIRALTEPQKRR